jgi:hypothetical protein
MQDSSRRLARIHHASCWNENDTRNMQGKLNSLLSDYGPCGYSHRESQFACVQVKWPESLWSLVRGQ